MTYNVKELLNIEKIKPLLLSYSKLTGLPFGIVEYPSREVLFSVGPTSMCKDFHFENKETLHMCNNAKQYLLRKNQHEKQMNITSCGLGPVCSSVPILVNNQIVAFLRCGQVFFEEPDLIQFQHQAEQYGFDKDKYIEAIKNVTVMPEERFKYLLEFLSNMAVVLAELGENHHKINEKNKYLETLFGSINAEIYVCSEDYRIEYANSLFLKRFGDNTINDYCYNAIYCDTEICLHCKIENIKDLNKNLVHEKYNKIDNRWDRITFAPLNLPDEKKSYIIIIKDITQEKKSQELLRLTQYAVDNASVGAIQVDSESNILVCNKDFCNSLGYSKEEIAKLKLKDILFSNDDSLWQEYWNELKGSKNLSYELILTRKDGSHYPIIINSNYLEFENNEVVFCYIIDLTDLKRSEEEKLEAQSKFQVISDTALDAIIMINNLGNVTYWSKAAEKIFGYTNEDILGKNLHQILVPEKFKKAHVDGFKEFIKTGKGAAIGKTLELTALKKDGSEFFVEVSVSSLQLYGEWHAVGIIRDITERKSLEMELEYKRKNLEKLVDIRTKELKDSLIFLEEANKQKNRFLSTMSHELRTPLNAVIGFSETLSREYFGSLNDKQKEYTTLISNAGEHLLALINDILDIAIIDAGSVDMCFSDFSIYDYISEMVSLMSTQFRKKEISISFEAPKDMVATLSDKRKSKQILLNLMTNALKFTPEKGEVKIIAEKLNDKYLKISVIDSGIGIDEEDRDKIFKDFYQSKKTFKDALGGAGIGLALCKRLVEKQGGEIGFDSEPDKGSTFWFTLKQKKYEEIEN